MYIRSRHSRGVAIDDDFRYTGTSRRWIERYGTYIIERCIRVQDSRIATRKILHLTIGADGEISQRLFTNDEVGYTESAPSSDKVVVGPIAIRGIVVSQAVHPRGNNLIVVVIIGALAPSNISCPANRNGYGKDFYVAVTGRIFEYAGRVPIPAAVEF